MIAAMKEGAKAHGIDSKKLITEINKRLKWMLYVIKVNVLIQKARNM